MTKTERLSSCRNLLSSLLLLPGVRSMAQVAMLHLKSMPDTVLPQMLLHKANPALGAWHVKTMPVRIVGDLPAGAAARALTN